MNDFELMLKLGREPIASSHWYVTIDEETSEKAKKTDGELRYDYEYDWKVHVEGEFTIENLNDYLPQDLVYDIWLYGHGPLADPNLPTVELPLNGQISWHDSDYWSSFRDVSSTSCKGASGNKPISGVMKLLFIEFPFSITPGSLFLHHWNSEVKMPTYDVPCVDQIGILKEQYTSTRIAGRTNSFLGSGDSYSYLAAILPLQPGTYISKGKNTTAHKWSEFKTKITLRPLCEITWVVNSPDEEPISCDTLNLPIVYARAPAGGSNYKWTIMSGQDKVIIVSGESARDLELQLSKPSDIPNDVVIAVSYQDNNGNTSQCQTTFSILRATKLNMIEERRPPFATDSLEVERDYQVLSQFDEIFALQMGGLNVRETLSSIDVNGVPVTWSSGTRKLSCNPNLPEFVGPNTTFSVSLTAQSAKTDLQGVFHDTLRIWNDNGIPLPAEMDFKVHQEIFVDDCLVGSYEIHYKNDHVTIRP